MFRVLARWTLGLTGVGLYCYDHQHKIKSYILGEEEIKAPHYTEYPPTFEVELKPGFEKEFDKEITEMENTIKDWDETNINNDKTFRGRTQRADSGEIVPNGVGCLKEKKGSTYTGKFDSGIMDGYVKIVTPEEKFHRVEKCLYEKGNKQYTVVYHEDGVRCEGTSDNFGCVRPDGSVYSEKIDKENKTVKSFLYDSEFKLKSERTLNYPEKIGQGRHFYSNGNIYIGEMNATGPYGKGIIKDKHGDVIFEGVVDNEMKPERKRIYRTAFTLCCLVGSFLV